ncbi:hypothetical protein [uncultured Paracoccus sp.]|uniref:hypothetical protein n=1 Tax=uncultured Paracoccus sp. TaxID=189685 RepID=UPI0025DD29E6|nr:hypothetical protein [uncultured Paracoccus sp.]
MQDVETLCLKGGQVGIRQAAGQNLVLGAGRQGRGRRCSHTGADTDGRGRRTGTADHAVVVIVAITATATVTATITAIVIPSIIVAAVIITAIVVAAIIVATIVIPIIVIRLGGGNQRPAVGLEARLAGQRQQQDGKKQQKSWHGCFPLGQFVSGQ